MNSDNVLQHQLNKFGVVTVMDVLLMDTNPENPVPVLFLDTLKITSLEQEGEQKEIRGGIGAPKLISYDFARTVTLEIQDALASMSSLATLWGGAAIEKGYAYTAIFTATAEEGTVTIPTEFEANESMNVKSALVVGPEESYPVTAIAGQKLTVTGVPAGKKVKVFLPDGAINNETGAIGLAINSIDVPPTVKMIGQTFFIDQATGKQIPMQLEIPLLKINIGGGLSMEAEGDAAVFDFSAEALAESGTKDFFRLKPIKAQNRD